MLTGSVLFAFARNCINLFDIANMPEGTLKVLVSRCIAALTNFGQGFERAGTDPNTEVLDEKDSRRDQFFMGLKNFVRAFTYHDDPAMVSAADRLMKVIARHGTNAANLSYSKETTAIAGLDRELNGKYTEEVTLLNANYWVSKLVTAQQEFEAAVKGQIEDGSVEVPTVTKFRPAMVNSLKMLFQSLEIEYEAHHDPTIEVYIEQVDELIGNTMAIAKAQETRRENQKEAEQTDIPQV
jgi:hypothetical protein